MDATPRRRLRWYQYSLRSLFVLTVLVAIAGSWFACKKQQVERERAAAEAIRELGGSVRYDWELDEMLPALNPDGQPPGPLWLRAWLGDDFFAHVAWVACSNGRTSDRDLETIEVEYLKDLPQLRTLVLQGYQASNLGLEHLKKVPNLRHLRLKNSRLTDDGLRHLKDLPALAFLDIDQTEVTDEGLESLRGALPHCLIMASKNYIRKTR